MKRMFSGSLGGARSTTTANLSGGSVHQVGCFSASCVAMGMAPRSRMDLVMLCHRSSHTCLHARFRLEHCTAKCKWTSMHA